MGAEKAAQRRFTGPLEKSDRLENVL